MNWDLQSPHTEPWPEEHQTFLISMTVMLDTSQLIISLYTHTKRLLIIFPVWPDTQNISSSFSKGFAEVLQPEKSQHLLQGEFTDLFNHTGDRGVLMQQVSKMLRAWASICTQFPNYGYLLRGFIIKAF